ncbi:MAG: hypothetical protein PHH58_10285 [Rhodoferax sp.]|nr:hypothetical protein [Rhodoferax sp.]
MPNQGHPPRQQSLRPARPGVAAARDFGDVWTLTELWNALGCDGLRTVVCRTRHSFDVEALIHGMEFNRRCEPDSKLGVLRWLETVALPDTSLESIDHPHSLRAMDASVEHKAEVDDVTASLLRPLVDQDLAMVLYEMTTIKGVTRKIVTRFPIKRVIALADRGWPSTDNLADLQEIMLPGCKLI